VSLGGDMSDDKKLDVRDFGASFKGFMEQMARQAPSEEPELRRRAKEHFGRDVSKLPVVSERFFRYDHPNVHLALEAWVSVGGRTSELLGITVVHEMFGTKLSQLFAPVRAGPMGNETGAGIGPVEYHNVDVGDGSVVACVATGLYFIEDGEKRFAILTTAPRERFGDNAITVQVMGFERAACEAVLAEIRNNMRKKSVYRGRVISLEQSRSEGLDVKFHRLPSITREGIILPEGVLERIERQTVRFSELKDELLKRGRHLKRGVLLYGPPGTGKTLTAMHLASRMPDRTILLLTGRTLGLIEQSCAMARLLQPATVILEDVDLIAEERTRNGVSCNTVLFELLNQMDGLADDADILFLLTTNRPEILEPALASRPGRIDQAVEVPAPDEQCRDRLLDLYGKGLTLALSDRKRFIARTKGVSASFIRELLRRAALFAADEKSDVVADKHLDVALQELAVDGGKLTQSLLGATGIGFTSRE
jgi:hypothetical protein